MPHSRSRREGHSTRRHTSSSSSLDLYDDDQGELTAYYVRPVASPLQQQRPGQTPLGSMRGVHANNEGRSGSADTNVADYYSDVQSSEDSTTIRHTTHHVQRHTNTKKHVATRGTIDVPPYTTHTNNGSPSALSTQSQHNTSNSHIQVQLVSSTPTLGRRGGVIVSSSSSSTTTTIEQPEQQDVIDVPSSSVSTVSDVPHPDALSASSISSSSSHSATRMTWMTVPPPPVQASSYNTTSSSSTLPQPHHSRERVNRRHVNTTNTTTSLSSTSLGNTRSQPATSNANHSVSRNISTQQVASAPHETRSEAGTLPSRIVTVLPMESTRIGPAPHALVPRELHVAQSVFTDDNPFRVQSFDAFCRNPIYDPPPGLTRYEYAGLGTPYEGQTDSALVASSSNNDSNGMTLSTGDRLMRCLLAGKPRSGPERAATLRAVQELARGTWFYKWTRSNAVHRRYVWLDLEQGVLRWSGQPPSRHIAFSALRCNALRLADVTALTTDVLRAGKSERLIYRMALQTMNRRIYFASELREKFDLWYTMLQRLTRPSRQGGIPGIWARPHAQASNTGGNGAVGRWASRYSPLQAVVEGNYPGYSSTPSLGTW